jgi:hypothetical protein
MYDHSDATIAQTLQLVNSFYQQIGLNFVLAAPPNRVATTFPYVHGPYPDNNYERQLKNTLRRGGVADLNIYTAGYDINRVRATNYILYGWATFPYQYRGNPQNDGIVYRYNFLPGVPVDQNGIGGPRVNTGKTMVHEVGHWLGLFHTFQDVSTSRGGFILQLLTK